jgi:hypothetical protein
MESEEVNHSMSVKTSIAPVERAAEPAIRRLYAGYTPATQKPSETQILSTILSTLPEFVAVPNQERQQRFGGIGKHKHRSTLERICFHDILNYG